MFDIQDFIQRFNSKEIYSFNFGFYNYYDAYISFDSIGSVLEINFCNPNENGSEIDKFNKKITFYIDYRKYFENVTTDEEAIKAVSKGIHDVLVVLYTGN